MTDNLDFNGVGPQRSFDVIPDNTICVLHMRVIPGQAGPDGWLTRSRDGASLHLNCESTVTVGEHAKRKIFERLTVEGAHHDEAISISKKKLGAMLESARGVRPDDQSDAAKEARRTRGWGEFDHLTFIARVGVEPPKNGYAAKNFVREVITPDKKDWRKPEPPPADPNGPAPAGNSGAAASTQQSLPLANAIQRPTWAEGK